MQLISTTLNSVLLLSMGNLSRLPADFFDPNISKEDEAVVDGSERENTIASTNSVSNLPAGSLHGFVLL